VNSTTAAKATTKPGVSFQSPLTEYVIGSASQLVSRFLEAEVEEFLSGHANLTDENGKPRIVRNGYLPERKVRTSLGKVPVKIPRVRDRLQVASDQKIKFCSKIISPYQRRTSSDENLVPRFLTEMISGDYMEATAAVLGSRVTTVDTPIIERLIEISARAEISGESFKGRRLRYVWVDRIPLRTERKEPLPIDETGEGRSSHPADKALIVAVGESDWGKKHLLFVFEDERLGQSLYNKVLKRVTELGLEGEPLFALSDACWAL